MGIIKTRAGFISGSKGKTPQDGSKYVIVKLPVKPENAAA